MYDISGTCNASCPWCDTGARICNILPKSNMQKPLFVDASSFKKRVEYLLKNKIITQNCTIYIYNWGEPLLNKEFYKIVETINDFGMKVGLSTNGSRIIENKVSFAHLDYLCFSMSGFSQKSYDKAHGFDFNKIIQNIEKSVENLKEANAPLKAMVITNHIYKHNMDEIDFIEEFAIKLGINFSKTSAHFNSFDFLQQYLEGNLETNILNKANQELFLDDITKLKLLRPDSYICPQYSFLTLSHRGQLSLCCTVQTNSSDYELLDFDEYEEITLEQIHQKRVTSKTCQICTKLGMDYIMNEKQAIDDTNTIFNRLLNNLITQTKKLSIKYDRIALYGNGNIANIIKEHIPNLIIIADQQNYIDNPKVCHPNNLLNYEFDVIIITVLRREKYIQNYLENVIKIQKERIISFELN